MNYRTGDRVGDGLREFQYAYTNRIDSLFQNTSRTSTPSNLGFRIGGDYYPSTNKTIGYTLDILDHEEVEQNRINYLVNTINPDFIGENRMEENATGYHIDHVISYENKYDAKEELLKAYGTFAHEIDDVFETGTMESQYGSDMRNSDS